MTAASSSSDRLGARRLPVAAEVALAAVSGAASFLIIAVILSVADSDVVALLLAVAAGAAVLEIAHRWGAAYAIPAAVLGLVAYDWFVFPPTHPEAFPDRNNLLSLLAYIGIGTVAGELAAYAARRAESSEAARALLADEQAALRRVATVVARGASRQQVFEALARRGRGKTRSAGTAVYSCAVPLAGRPSPASVTQTRSPAWIPVTPGPTASTTPAVSWLGTVGSPASPPKAPLRDFQSVGLTPDTATRIRTSPAAGSSEGRSTTCRTDASPVFA